MVDINTLVLPGADIEVIDAYDINDRGEIAGRGVRRDGVERAVLLIPCDADHADTKGCENARDLTTDITRTSPVPLARFPVKVMEGDRAMGAPRSGTRFPRRGP
jgi:hypothetical protein